MTLPADHAACMSHWRSPCWDVTRRPLLSDHRDHTGGKLAVIASATAEQRMRRQLLPAPYLRYSLQGSSVGSVTFTEFSIDIAHIFNGEPVVDICVGRLTVQEGSPRAVAVGPTCFSSLMAGARIPDQHVGGRGVAGAAVGGAHGHGVGFETCRVSRHIDRECAGSPSSQGRRLLSLIVSEPAFSGDCPSAIADQA